MSKSNFDKLDPQEKRELVASVVENTVSNFLYYDRKGDEDLGVDDIENAVRDEIITVDEIVQLFREQLEHNLV